MSKSTKKPVFIISVITDQEKGWKFESLDGCKAMIFMMPVTDKKLTKKDIRFIESNIKTFSEQPEATVQPEQAHIV